MDTPEARKTIEADGRVDPAGVTTSDQTSSSPGTSSAYALHNQNNSVDQDGAANSHASLPVQTDPTTIANPFQEQADLSQMMLMQNQQWLSNILPLLDPVALPPSGPLQVLRQDGMIVELGQVPLQIPFCLPQNAFNALQQVPPFNVLAPHASAATPPSAPTLPPGSYSSFGRSMLLFLTVDEETLSEYQCLVRKQIEVFEATQNDLNANAQGRNKPIIQGQVGIRCRHCSKRPRTERTKGSVYFPSQLKGLYQTAQNMANSHLLKDCRDMPPELRTELIRLRERKSSVGGGSRYWADGLKVLGVIETLDRRLLFNSSAR